MAKWLVQLQLNDAVPSEAAILVTIRNNSATLTTTEQFSVQKVAP